ncbi:MAG: hypothetical protein KAU28_03105 [Phycisphaerae bacterium]|nr:hypothetical protein [Phycisphaerae bacterium]
MAGRDQHPAAKPTDQIVYHLFLDLAAAVGATDLRFKMANPVMGSDDAPAPSGRLEYVVRAMHISLAADTTLQIRNATGDVWKLDVAGGAGSLYLAPQAPFSVGKGEYPRLTMSTTEKITIHLFCTMEPAPYVPARS